jgi:hypothetical protein
MKKDRGLSRSIANLLSSITGQKRPERSGSTSDPILEALLSIAEKAGGWDSTPRFYPVIGFPSDMGHPEMFVPSIYRLGHFYSPMISRTDISKTLPEPKRLGFDLNAERQAAMVADFGKYVPPVRFPRTLEDETSYFTDNGQFSGFDALVLWNMIARNRPSKIVEIGSGYSTLLMNACIQNFGLDTKLVCIEPYPRPFLRKLRGVSHLHEQRLEDSSSLELFESLGPSDILFLDSSHVSKTNSDVNFFVFNILPILQPGVVVHVHDIFIPDEYPSSWLQEGRSWNEQYILRAFLMGNTSYSIEFLSHWFFKTFPEVMRSAPGYFEEYATGGSLWMVRNR